MGVSVELLEILYIYDTREGGEGGGNFRIMISKIVVLGVSE